jgi:hypothetical protein
MKMVVMRVLLSRFRGFYGGHPLHLVVVLACFGLTGYVAARVAVIAAWPVILVWFLGAVIGHDLVLFPVYAVVDRFVVSLLGVVRRGRRAARVPVVNYVRVPLLGVGLTFLLFLPGVVRQGAVSYLAATGQTQQPFLWRWLWVCVGMFVVSGVVYVVRWFVVGVPTRAALRVVRARFVSGERIRAVGETPGGAVGAVASSHAFYRPGDAPGTWLRTPWADLADVEWDAGDGTLTVTVTTDGAGPTALRLDTPTELLRVVADCVDLTDRGRAVEDR